MDTFLELRRYFPIAGQAEGAGEVEDDPESLPARKEEEVPVLYNILYDPNYRVPVLYFTPPPPPPPQSSRTVLEEMGFADGAVSQGEHPLTGEVWWFVHPCRTAETMGVRWGGGVGQGVEGRGGYLAIWLGTVGGGLAEVVGLGVRG